MRYQTSDSPGGSSADRTEKLRHEMNKRGYDVRQMMLMPGRPELVFIHRVCSALVWNPDAHDLWHQSNNGTSLGDSSESAS